MKKQNGAVVKKLNGFKSTKVSKQLEQRIKNVKVNVVLTETDLIERALSEYLKRPVTGADAQDCHLTNDDSGNSVLHHIGVAVGAINRTLDGENLILDFVPMYGKNKVTLKEESSVDIDPTKIIQLEDGSYLDPTQKAI